VGRPINEGKKGHLGFLATQVQEAREEGHEALDAAWQERWQRLAQAQAWPNLAQDMAALARQLDALDEEEGGTGRVRVQLWERERDQSWGF
jgi:hypothetical protein